MLPVSLALMWEALVSHDERRKSVGEGIDAGPRLHVGALVGPDNVEARVDAWYREAVEGRVAERERRQVVRMRQLLAIMVSLWCDAQRQRTATCACTAAIHTWCMMSFNMSTGRSSSRSGPLPAFSFPLDTCFTGSAAVDAPAALGTVSWLGQPSSASSCVAVVCASSGEEESDCAMSSWNVNGDAVLAVPGVESGEAMSLSSS